MAEPRTDLSAFVGKLLEEHDGDVLREGVRVLAQALMESAVTTLAGAERHERSDAWTAYRNGTRVRSWDTRVATVDLAIPKVVGRTSRRCCIFNVLNAAVQVIFVVEITVRLLAYGPRMHRFFLDGWNVFDLTIVAARRA